MASPLSVTYDELINLCFEWHKSSDKFENNGKEINFDVCFKFRYSYT